MRRIGYIGGGAALAWILSATVGAALQPRSAKGHFAAPTPRAQAAIQGGCRLFADDADRVSTHECLSCHTGGVGAQLRTCHPIELPYPPASNEPPLRPLEDAVRRGAFLPGNVLRCVTCHDRSSPWDSAIALPPGAKPMRGVVPGDATTYSPDKAAPPRPGDRVTPTALCLECHAYD
ncbi:MAG TPA: hypothetical protein VFE30_12000 [Anaeromyxobacteraceae bacterium]|nr:hypothetical protein [Anaeromyxobacteraceae bacterium]